MSRLFATSRYIVPIPILGLVLAAAAMFTIGGFNLMQIPIETLLHSAAEGGGERLPLAVIIVEHVHELLIGTVLYITVVGLYQLFIHQVNVPEWLRISNANDSHATKSPTGS